jgi:hypothetical protein
MPQSQVLSKLATGLARGSETTLPAFQEMKHVTALSVLVSAACVLAVKKEMELELSAAPSPISRNHLGWVAALKAIPQTSLDLALNGRKVLISTDPALDAIPRRSGTGIEPAQCHVQWTAGIKVRQISDQHCHHCTDLIGGMAVGAVRALVRRSACNSLARNA